MAIFAEKLKSYIEKSGQTIYMVAQSSGVNRTLIHRMTTGARIPSKKETVALIAKSLLLSPADTNDLLEAYEMSKRGESAYRQLQLVKQLLINCARPSLSNLGVTPPRNFCSLNDFDIQIESSPKLISQRSQINQIIRLLLDQELQKPDGHVCLISQPDYTYLYDTLAAMTTIAPTAKIQNIICFDRSNENNDCYNLYCLEKLVPTLLANPSFEALCYYDHVNTLFNEWSLLPYMLLTSNYALCFSDDTNQAMLYNDKNVIRFMRQHFNKKLSCTNPICYSIKTSFDTYMNSLLVTEAKEPPEAYTLLYQPCLMPFINLDIIVKYVNTEICTPEMIQHMAAHIANIHHPDAKIHTAFTQEGLELFMETGRITEVPSQFYQSLDMNSRKEVLHNMMQAIEAGSLIPRIIDTTRFDMPMSLSVDALSPNQIIIYLNHDADNAFSLIINEPSLMHAFYEFLVYIQTSRLVYSKDETITILKNIEAKYL